MYLHTLLLKNKSNHYYAKCCLPISIFPANKINKSDTHTKHTKNVNMQFKKLTKNEGKKCLVLGTCFQCNIWG